MSGISTPTKFPFVFLFTALRPTQVSVLYCDGWQVKIMDYILVLYYLNGRLSGRWHFYIYWIRSRRRHAVECYECSGARP